MALFYILIYFLGAIITVICAYTFYVKEYKRKETTYIVKFKDGSQMEIVGHCFTTSKKYARIMSSDGSYTFNRDELLFFNYYNNSDRPYVCIGVEGINEFKQCIPYDGNEHLLGTTDDCDGFYKTWEE